MTTKIAKVANLALHVFRAHSLRSSTNASSHPPSSTDHSHQNGAHTAVIDDIATSEALKQLLTSVASLTLHDVGLHSPFAPLPQLTAPVVYMHIAENEIFSMGMFILRPGSRIPLHDHPGMFGVIRVMQGSMRCRSFTPLCASPTNSNAPLPAQNRWRLSTAPDLTVAEPHSDKLLGPGDVQPCLLTPRLGNLHELTAVEGTVVFLDILAPPYDHDLGTRECVFYREIDMPHEETAGRNVEQPSSPRVYLTETNQPRDYWCETVPYHGPAIT